MKNPLHAMGLLLTCRTSTEPTLQGTLILSHYSSIDFLPDRKGSLKDLYKTNLLTALVKMVGSRRNNHPGNLCSQSHIMMLDEFLDIQKLSSAKMQAFMAESN